MAVMKIGMVKTNKSDTPNTMVAARCPVCGYKRWVLNGVDQGCPGMCVETKKTTKVTAPKE